MGEPRERPLRLGLVTPVVSLLPGTPEWEESAGASELATIARAADELGYEHVTCSEHVGVPRADLAVRGARFYDPLATLSYVAALTARIKLLTHVVVLPYHHPLAIAKRYGTLDRLSGGRLVLGVGVGSLRAEFELLGADFDARGPRYEEALVALAAALGKREPAFRGEHFSFEGFVIDPCAVQERVPIWLGGRTPRSLRRAVSLAQGWVPFGLTLEEIRALLARARETAEWKEREERGEPLEIALAVECADDLSSATSVAALVDRLERTREAGATIASLTVRARSAEHYVDQIAHIMAKAKAKAKAKASATR